MVGMGTLVEHRCFDDLIEASALLADDRKLHTLIAGSDHEDPACGERSPPRSPQAVDGTA